MKNLSRHSGRFGRDSTVTNPGASLEQSVSLNKMNRNPLPSIIETSPDVFVTASKHDNFFVQHQIPRSDIQYSWVTGSVAQNVLDGDIRFYGYAPTYGPQAGYYATGSGTSRRYKI